MLEIKGLVKRFPGRTALNGVDLTIKRGERIGIIGPNGSGKSTLLGTVLGMIEPTAGTVTLDGNDITRLAPSHPRRARIACMFQTASVFPPLSVLDNVMLTALATGKAFKTARADAQTMIGHLGLAAAAERDVVALSGGQRRIADFARALVTEATFLLLDEPTSGVNLAVQAIMSKMILDLGASGERSVVIVSHDMEWLFPLVTRVVVMQSGEVSTQGTVAEIRSNTAVIDAFLR
ncbi:MAG: ABC transporter ATP-binding protein [Lautropia sp.]